jgi:site-specific recombinase XerC
VPPGDTLKGKRDCAILATFLHHGLRCEGLCGLRVRASRAARACPHLRILGKGSQVRYVPVHPLTTPRAHPRLPPSRRPRRGRRPAAGLNLTFLRHPIAVR